MSNRPHPKRTRTDPSRPEAWGTSDRAGWVGNHKDLNWQFEFAGLKLINLKILVYADELDKPQRQLGTIILPPDPLPILNARPEQYNVEEQPVSYRTTIDGSIRAIITAAFETVERIVTTQGNLAKS